MARDSSYTYVHYHSSKLADMLEEFSRSSLVPEDIFVPAVHQPPNPEDEDDVVPDQHAAFGIQRATQPRREPAWRDLGLQALLRSDGWPGFGSGSAEDGSGAGGEGVGGVRNGGGGAEGAAGVSGAGGAGTGAASGPGAGQIARPGTGRSAGHTGPNGAGLMGRMPR